MAGCRGCSSKRNQKVSSRKLLEAETESLTKSLVNDLEDNVSTRGMDSKVITIGSLFVERMNISTIEEQIVEVINGYYEKHNLLPDKKVLVTQIMAILHHNLSKLY